MYFKVERSLHESLISLASALLGLSVEEKKKVFRKTNFEQFAVIFSAAKKVTHANAGGELCMGFGVGMIR